MNDLHERIAAALGWKVADTQQFSLQALRELIPASHPKLVAEITSRIQTGEVLIGERRKGK